MLVKMFDFQKMRKSHTKYFVYTIENFVYTTEKIVFLSNTNNQSVSKSESYVKIYNRDSNRFFTCFSFFGLDQSYESCPGDCVGDLPFSFIDKSKSTGMI